MNNEVSYLAVTGVVENEDGSADYTFNLDDKTKKVMAETGLHLVLTCAAYDLRVDEAIQTVESVGKALRDCRDVSVDDVVEMVYGRQRELEQEPEGDK